MSRTGKITLNKGVGKASGKPFKALKLEAGKWNTLFFPTSFELDYLEEYLEENQGTFTLNPVTGLLNLVAGDYEHDYEVESKFEQKYLENYFRDAPTEARTSTEDDNKLDLDNEEPAGSIFDN